MTPTTSIKMKKSFYALPLLLAAAAFFASCKPDPDPPPTNGSTDFRKGMWILNEGQFLSGNAGISWITYDGATRKTDAFYDVNSRPLGDVGQSITVIGSKAYVVVNNSGKIEVLSTATMASTGSITGFTSPRYLQEVSAGKAYVTDLFGGSISIVDLETRTITGSIPAAGWTEQMVVKGNEVFVGLADTNFVYVINSTSNTITDTLIVTKGVTGMTLDAAGNLWVLCNGGYNEYLPALYRIDPSSHAITGTFTFASVTEDPAELVYDAANDDLLFINMDVYRFDIGSGALPSAPLVSAGTSFFYSLGFDATRNYVCVGDAGDFVSAGRLLRYDAATGAAIDTIAVGVSPGDFWIQ